MHSYIYIYIHTYMYIHTYAYKHTYINLQQRVAVDDFI